jgi:hypothetical protein
MIADLAVAGSSAVPSAAEASKDEAFKVADSRVVDLKDEASTVVAVSMAEAASMVAAASTAEAVPMVDTAKFSTVTTEKGRRKAAPFVLFLR